MAQVQFFEVIPRIAGGIIALLFTGLFLRTLIRQSGVHPSRYSLRIRTARKHSWWTEASFIRASFGSVLQKRRTPVAFVALVALAILAGFVLTRLATDIGWSSVPSLWQVHATVVGLSFVVIVFLLDFVSRSSHVDAVLSHFVETSFVKPVLYFSLIGTMSMGVASLYNALLPPVVTPDYVVALFVITVLAIVGVYYRIISMILDESPDDYSYELMESQISRKVENDAKAHYCNIVLEEELSEDITVTHFRYGLGPRQDDSITSADLGTRRYISDIHLWEFREAVGELHQILEAVDDESRIVGEAVTVRCDVRINQDTDEYPILIDASQELSELDLDAVERKLQHSILSTSSPPWPTPVDDPYEFVDYLEQKGIQTVREGEFGSYAKFLENYRQLMEHGMDKLIQHEFLIREGVYFEFESPFYSLERIPISVFEECLRTRDREQALETVAVLNDLTARSFDQELLLPFHNFITIYSSFIFNLSMRQADLPVVFQVGIMEQIVDFLRRIFRNAVIRDEEEFDSIESYRVRQTSYAFAMLKQFQEMLKYTLDVEDIRGFMRVWEIPGIPRSVSNTNIGEQIRQEINQLLFSAGSLSYTVAKQDDEHKAVFEILYNRKLRREYQTLTDLSEVYFSVLKSDRNPPRWTQWSTQEHDVIQGEHGRPVFLRNELTEFYCFLGIASLNNPEIKDDNPLQDSSISEADYNSIKFAVRELVRRMQLFDVDDFLEEDTVEDRAERFLEYHEEIVDEREEDQIT